MSSRDPDTPLRGTLRGSYRSLCAGLGMRLGVRAMALLVTGGGAALVLGTFLGLGETAAWVRLVLVLAFAAAVIAAAALRYRRSLPGFESYLERVEERFPQVRSWLRNALDLQQHPSGHTSPELARALCSETNQRLKALPLEELRPRLEARRPAWLLVASIAAVALLGALTPARFTRSWATLWSPSLAAPPVRLSVEPGSVKITPGSALTVRARVWGSPRKPALLRDGEAGMAAIPEGRSEGAQVWRFDLTQLTREQDYRVRVASLESPRYRISLAGEPVPVSFQIEYRSPTYARLPVQRGAATRGDLSALRGTRARVEVTFDRDLTALAATLPGGGHAPFRPVTARRWQGELTVDREGDYELDARAQGGEGRYRYRVTPLADAPPLIAVRTPEGDLDLPAGQQIPLEILGQDDLGLSELKLEFRKDPSKPWTEVPLARFSDHPREATVQSRWDASSLALLPGETATFRFELLDDNALTGRGHALSPTFELRFPTLGELYDDLDRKQGGVQNTLEKVAEQAQELQKSLDKLSRQPPMQASPQSAQAYERSEEMKSALEHQQQLGDKIDQATQQLRESLEKAAERQAFDREMVDKLKEMAHLMEQIQSPEFKDALRKMQEALENLDRRALDQNLPQWRMESSEMLSNLQRTVDLLKQLRREEQLDALAKRAEELKTRQDALNQEHQNSANQSGKDRQQESKALADQQERQASETERLAKDARDLAKEMESKAEQKLEDAASELEKQAAPAQHEASQSAGQQRLSRARQMGEKASESLERAAQSLSQLADEMQQEREGADLAAVRRAAQDLVSLQREAEGNLGSSDPVPERADRQTDLSDGASRVADSLYVLGRKSPFITPKLSEAMGRAINQLSTSGRELGTGNRMRGEEAGKGGSAALNEAVLLLREAESSMCKNGGQPGGSKPSNSTMRMGQLGQQQSQLNSESGSLARRLSQQIRLSAGDRDQLARYADEQRRLREQLEEIQRDEQLHHELLGKLEGTRRDMQEVEEVLRNGTTDGELEQKQQRILSRLLDAQRSVNRRDFDPERESRPGEDIASRSAPELPPELLKETDRLRLDMLKVEADRYPAQYRAFIEAYLRALNGSRR